MKKIYATKEEYKAAMKARIKERYQTDPEYRKKVLEMQKRRREKNKDELNRRLRERWASDEEFRQKSLIRQKEYVETHKEEASEYQKKRYATAEAKRKGLSVEEYLKRREQKHNESLHKIKLKARAKLATRASYGTIKRQPCEVCGKEPAEAHHCDYTKPLDVMWLCREHHLEWHKNNMPIYPQNS